MTQKKKVIIHLTDADYEFGEYLACWSKKQTNKYLSNMQKVKFISECMDGITLCKKLKVDYYDKDMVLEIELDVPSSLDMLCNKKHILLPSESEQCLKNIKSGKCRDPFVIEHIGKIFFADKYNKQK